MGKLKNELTAIKYLMEFIGLMMKETSKLSDDIDNNYVISKKISNKVIEMTNINLSVEGAENIPLDDSAMIISNHRSFFDIMLLISSIDRTISFAAAKELYSYPILNKYINALDCVQIDRDTKNISVMKKQAQEMNEAVKKGCLAVFAEGECNYLGNEIREFKKGGFMSAAKLNSLIIPTYINVNKVKNIGRWTIPCGDVSIHYGKAFRQSDVGDGKIRLDELTEYTYQQVLTLQKGVSK